MPPTAPESVTAPPSASSVSDCEPAVAALIVELKSVMSPSVESLSPSVSIVTSAPRTTARAKVRLLSSTVMSPFSVVVLPAVCVSVSVPASVTAPSVTSPPVIDRLFSFLVPPAAPVIVTSPVLASSVSDCEPAVFASIVELKLMSPSDVSLSASLSTVTLVSRSTAPVKLMSPSSLL